MQPIAAMGGGDNNSNRRRRREEDQDDGMGSEDDHKDLKRVMLNPKIIEVLMKLALSSALQVRVLRSVVITVYMVASSMPWVVKAKETMAKWASDAKMESDRDKVTLPHMVLFRSIVASMLIAKESMPENLHQQVIAYDKDMTDQSERFQTSRVKESISHCKVAKAFDKSKVKIEISFTTTEQATKLAAVIDWFLTKGSKGRKLEGVAPPGDLGRSIMKALADVATDK